MVADCRAALRAGVRERGVTALHDATEGGVLGGLLELARACGHDLVVERARIPLAPEARAACEVFGTDPYWTLSEGTLIATARPARAPAVLAALADAGIPAAEVGEVVPGGGTLRLAEPGGATSVLTEPSARSLLAGLRARGRGGLGVAAARPPGEAPHASESPAASAYPRGVPDPTETDRTTGGTRAHARGTPSRRIPWQRRRPAATGS